MEENMNENSNENSNENVNGNAAQNPSEDISEAKSIETKNRHVCFETHCWKKCLAMICAAFFGGFLAFYFAADQVMHKYHYDYFDSDRFEQKMFNDIDKIYLKNLHDIEKNFDEPEHFMPRFGHDKFDLDFLSVNPVKVKTETEDNKFNIVVCLKPFQNDENKVNYEVKPGKIRVYGSSDTKHNNVEENVSFSQDFLLPQNADINNITKIKDGKKLVISIPVKK